MAGTLATVVAEDDRPLSGQRFARNSRIARTQRTGPRARMTLSTRQRDRAGTIFRAGVLHGRRLALAASYIAGIFRPRRVLRPGGPQRLTSNLRPWPYCAIRGAHG